MKAAFLLLAKPIAIALMGVLMVTMVFEVLAFIKIADWVTGLEAK